MYTTKNFKTKKELKLAVDAWNRLMAILAQHDATYDHESNLVMPDRITLREFRQIAVTDAEFPDPILPRPVRLYAPGLGTPKDNGTEVVEGPHYPEPHRWYASVEVENGIVVKVK